MLEAQESVRLSGYLERLQPVVSAPEILELESGSQLPSYNRLLDYLLAKGFQVSEPQNYPEGVKIQVSSNVDGDLISEFQGMSLRESLLMAIEWVHQAG